MPSVLEVPSRGQIADEISRIAQNALASTRILSYVISMAHHFPQHASVLKAVDIATHFLGKNPAVAGASASHIKDQWKLFKPVAHLWCAAFLLKTENPDFGFPKVQTEELLHFLGTAEWLRHQGESILARAQKTPVLTPGESWIPPADLVLPVVTVEPGAPTAETLEVLERYRAPKKI